MIFLFWGTRYGAKTHNRDVIGCALFPEHAGIKMLALGRKLTEL